MRALKYVVSIVAWTVAAFVTLYLIFGATEDTINGAQAVVWLAVDAVLIWIGYAVWTPPADRRHRLPSR